MFVKLTNGAPGREDDPLHVNIDHITAVYEDKTDGGTLVTRVYSAYSTTTWTVQESLGEVIKTISAYKKSCSCS